MVSFLIAAYNVASTLDGALASVAAQTREDWEAIVVNDGSTDSTSALAHEWASRDPRFMVVDKENGGYGAAMNTALDTAHGDWVAILEPDDWIDPRFVELTLGRAEELTAAGRRPDIVRTSYWKVREFADGTSLASHCAYHGRIPEVDEPCSIEEVPQFLSTHPSIWAAIYRTDFLRERGIRFEEYPGAGWADNPFLIDTHVGTDRIAHVDESLYFYREDSVERARELVARDPLMPIARWMTMQDRVERLGATGPGVRAAQTKRALTYCATAARATDFADEEVLAACREALARLSPRDVFSGEQSPAAERFYTQITGIEGPPRSRLARLAADARWGAESVAAQLRSGGVRFTAMAVREHLANLRRG